MLRNHLGHFKLCSTLQICKIEQIVPKGKDVGMRVKWYYRPEETCSGRRVCTEPSLSMAPANHLQSDRQLLLETFNDSGVDSAQAFHSAQEVMASDHVESLLQPPASIVSKCSIHTLEEYMVGLRVSAAMHAPSACEQNC